MAKLKRILRKLFVVKISRSTVSANSTQWQSYCVPWQNRTSPMCCLLRFAPRWWIIWPVSFTCASAWTINEPHCSKEQPRCYAKSPTVQDAFQPIPGLISCAGVTGRWGLLSHAQNAACWSVFLGSWHATQWKIVAGSSICISLLPSPCAPPGEKRSGEQSWISWTNSQDRAGCVSANTRPRQLC